MGNMGFICIPKIPIFRAVEDSDLLDHMLEVANGKIRGLVPGTWRVPSASMERVKEDPKCEYNAWNTFNKKRAGGWDTDNSGCLPVTPARVKYFLRDIKLVPGILPPLDRGHDRSTLSPSCENKVPTRAIE